MLAFAAIAICEWGNDNDDMRTWAFWRGPVIVSLAFTAGWLRP